MSDPQLDRLVDAARSGDGDAYGELWRRLSPQIGGYLRGHRVRDADDLTSEVFLDCFRSIRTFTGDGEAFRRFLFFVARRRYIDWVRRSVTAGPVLPYDPEQDDRPALSAEDDALELIASEGVVELLAGLTVDQRDVLLLRLVADLTVEQVSLAVGKPVGAVKQLQRRGLDALRKKVAVSPYLLAGLAR
jgi:RNA polymerase sigma-70 factor (ECF subfamily)